MVITTVLVKIPYKGCEIFQKMVNRSGFMNPKRDIMSIIFVAEKEKCKEADCYSGFETETYHEKTPHTSDAIRSRADDAHFL
jgi:hypothetical protein